MNEVVILKSAFNRYCDLINDYNAKADETFLTSYNKKYMNDFIDIFEQIKRESGLNFNSEEAYGLLENEIKKAIENHQQSKNETNQKLRDNANKELDNNYSFEYDRVGFIADNLIKDNQDRVNEYSVSTVDENFITALRTMLYEKNPSIDNMMLNKCELTLSNYIEHTLKVHKTNMLEKCYQFDKYKSAKNVLEELHIFIEKNKVIEKRKKAAIPMTKSALKARAMFGLTDELLNEVVKSLKANVITMSDVDEIVSKSGHKEISEEDFKRKAQEQMNQPDLSSNEQFGTSIFKNQNRVFLNADPITNNNIYYKSKSQLNVLAMFGLSDDLVDEIINSLKKGVISMDDVGEIINQCEIRNISIEQAMEKINMAFGKEKSVYNTVFKNAAVAEENRSKRM